MPPRPSLTFRPAVPEDGVQLKSLHRRAILAAGADAYPLETALSWAHGLTAAGYADSMAEGERIEVALQGGRIVGFCGVRRDRIKGLFVDPDRRGCGIGSALLRRALRRIWSDGHAVARVRAALGAVPFYEGLGFRPVGNQTVHTRGGLPLPAVELVLDPARPPAFLWTPVVSPSALGYSE